MKSNEYLLDVMEKATIRGIFVKEAIARADRRQWRGESDENSSNSSASTDYPKRMGRPEFGTDENVGWRSYV